MVTTLKVVITLTTLKVVTSLTAFPGQERWSTRPPEGGQTAPVKVVTESSLPAETHPVVEPYGLQSSALSRAASDAHLILAGLGVDERLMKFIVAALEDRGVYDVAAYLLGIIAKEPHEIRDFLGRMRRALDAQDAGDDPRPPPKPPWCGECDERTRMVTVLGETPADDKADYCPNCAGTQVRP